MVKQARALATREQILTGAATVFSKQGYERAKLNDIVDAADLTRGALYFHYQSKEDVAVAVITRQHENAVAAAQSISTTKAPALAQLVMLSHEMGRQITDDPVVQAGIRLTLEMSAGEGPDEPYRDWITTCSRLTAAAQDEGDALATVDAADFGECVVSSFTGYQLVANVLTGRSDLEERIDRMWGYLLPSIIRPDSLHSLTEIRSARWTPH